MSSDPQVWKFVIQVSDVVAETEEDAIAQVDKTLREQGIHGVGFVAHQQEIRHDYPGTEHEAPTHF